MQPLRLIVNLVILVRLKFMRINRPVAERRDSLEIGKINFLFILRWIRSFRVLRASTSWTDNKIAREERAASSLLRLGENFSRVFRVRYVNLYPGLLLFLSVNINLI